MEAIQRVLLDYRVALCKIFQYYWCVLEAGPRAHTRVTHSDTPRCNAHGLDTQCVGRRE